MEMVLRGLLKYLLLPPAVQVLLVLAGLYWLRHRPALGRGLVAAGLLSLWALGMPVVTDALSARLERYPPVPPEQVAAAMQGVEAIVVLTAGSYYGAAEFGPGYTPNATGLERARYGAWLAKHTGLPLIVSGGRVIEDQGSLADDMARVLEQEFGVPHVIREDGSRTTWENALYTARLLGEGRPHRVAVVTHASHMPRSVLSFRKAGLEPVPMPTEAYGAQRRPVTLLSYVPRADEFARSAAILHEMIGLLWYEWAY